jgi:hypothetical protein
MVRFRLPGRMLATIVLALLACLVVVWQAGAWLVERPVQFLGTFAPTCGGSVDAAHHGAAGIVLAQVGSFNLNEPQAPSAGPALDVVTQTLKLPVGWIES